MQIFFLLAVMNNKLCGNKMFPKLRKIIRKYVLHYTHDYNGCKMISMSCNKLLGLFFMINLIH